MAVDLLHQVEGHADGDQQPGAPIETGHVVADSHRLGDEGGNDRDDGQEPGADVGNTNHYLFQVIGGSFAGAVAGDEGTVVLEVIRKLLRVECDSVVPTLSVPQQR